MSGGSTKDQVKAFLSGGFGGTCLVAVGHPLDLIKVRLQTSTEYKGVVDCASKTIAKDGVKGLYRGMAAPLVGVTPIFAVCFWGFEVGKQIARKMEGKGANEALSTSGILFAGGFSALPATAVMVPAERIKVLLQVQGQDSGPKKYNGALDCGKQIFKSEGVRGLYKGTGLTLMRDIPGSMAYYGAYEILRNYLLDGGTELSPMTTIFAGGMAGVFNWLVALPQDTLKSLYQTAPPGRYPGGIPQVFSEVMASGGVKALYRGLGPALLRAFPANAACFMGMEAGRKGLNYIWP
uniref:Mitochondrial carnitine/acylcarnitine carrier protein n=1 Tax=Paramoeba aestuarina TaxID=180227 RepID=A0A7S4P8F1_9EUKA|mmetsp:Transcript_38004/g.60068  ORF Transcript_38004/g.60068 Transcript_38004/m.60068 type:complete len:293 (+) Transcript_38004:901-1779(+)